MPRNPHPKLGARRHTMALRSPLDLPAGNRVCQANCLPAPPRSGLPALAALGYALGYSSLGRGPGALQWDVWDIRLILTSFN